MATRLAPTPRFARPPSPAQEWIDRAIGILQGREDTELVKPRVTLGSYCCPKSNRTECPEHGPTHQDVRQLLRAHGLTEQRQMIDVLGFSADTAHTLDTTPL